MKINNPLLLVRKGIEPCASQAFEELELYFYNLLIIKGLSMDHNQLEKKIAKLESVNDQLQAEFQTLNELLKKLGFEKGISTLKEAANEMLANKKQLPREEPSEDE